jgi:hypothetical protein
MKFSMTGQDKGDLLIEVTLWAGLTVYDFIFTYLLRLTPTFSIPIFFVHGSLPMANITFKTYMLVLVFHDKLSI